MKKTCLYFLFIICLGYSQLAHSQASENHSIDYDKNYTVEELGDIYKRLRINKNKYQNWGSELHHIMNRLLDSLKGQTVSQEYIIKLMGNAENIVISNNKCLVLNPSGNSYLKTGDGYCFFSKNIS